MQHKTLSVSMVTAWQYIKVKDNKWKKRWLILDESHLYLFKSHEVCGGVAEYVTECVAHLARTILRILARL